MPLDAYIILYINDLEYERTVYTSNIHKYTLKSCKIQRVIESSQYAY